MKFSKYSFARRTKAAFSLKSEGFNYLSLYYVFIFSCGLRVDYINLRHLSEFHNFGQRWTQPRYLAPLRELEKTTILFMQSSCDLDALLRYAARSYQHSTGVTFKYQRYKFTKFPHIQYVYVFKYSIVALNKKCFHCLF